MFSTPTQSEIDKVLESVGNIMEVETDYKEKKYLNKIEGEPCIGFVYWTETRKLDR